MKNKHYSSTMAGVAFIASLAVIAGLYVTHRNNKPVDISSSQADIIVTDELTTAEESSLNESSLKDNSVNSSKPESSSSKPDDSSSKICDSSNVQNESEIEHTETVYVETNSNQTYFEPVENNAYVGEPVQDNKTYEVVETPKSVGDAPVGCTEADVELLASLINHESSFSDEGRLMVGSVVVNRMNNTGDNVYDTIASTGQFTSPWGLNYYTDADYEAAEYVLENGATNTDVYYFTGCHGDGLNWFTDYNGNWVGAY